MSKFRVKFFLHMALIRFRTMHIEGMALGSGGNNQLAFQL